MGVQEREIAEDSKTQMEFRDELSPGTKLLSGQYTIRDFLGADGFGITYLALDSLERRVAIKECFPGAFCHREDGGRVEPRSAGHAAELGEIVRVFAEEARKLSNVEHPNIVGIHNVFEENGTAYIAMDFVDGSDLMEIISEGTEVFTTNQIKRFLDRSLDAVCYFHRCGILHRDISPANIIIREDDGEPVLIDFGAAREQATKASRILSVLRNRKDGYSPQELYISGSEQGPSSDLYSLAATYYHLITGTQPPGSQQRVSVRASGGVDPYISIGDLTTDFDDAFCEALDKAMSIIAEDRHQSAEDWINAIRPEDAAKAKLQLRVDAHRSDASEGLEDLSDFAIDEEEVLATAEIFDEDAETEADGPAPDAKSERPAPERVKSEFELVEAPTSVALGLSPRPASGSSDPLGFADPIDLPSKSGRVIKLVSAAAMIMFAGMAVLGYSQLNASRASFEVVTMAPVMATPEPTGSEEPLLAAGFETFEPNLPPMLLPSVSIVPEDHGISLALLTLPAAPAREEPSEALPILSEAPQAPVTPEPLPEPEVIAVAPPFVEEAPAPAELITEEATVAPIFVAPEEVEVPVAEPAEPEASETIVAQAAAPVPAPIVPGPSVVETSARLSLPFEADPSDPRLIGKVHNGAPEWLESGLQVSSIDGAPVTTVQEITALLMDKLEPNAPTIEARLGFMGPTDTEESVRSMTVTVAHAMELSNGMVFEARFEDGAWVTRVTDAPNDARLAVGDVMVGALHAMQPIDRPDAIRLAIDTEVLAGRQGVAFAVERQGKIWVETLDLGSL